MSARNCPKCQRELPVEILRALEQGTACPYCATRLKRAPRRSPTMPLPAAGDYGTLDVSHTPAVVAQPTAEDSYGWFQTKGSPGGGAPAAAAASAAPAAVVARPAFAAAVSAPVAATSPPAPARSPLKSLPTVAMPGLTPSTSGSREPVLAAPASVEPIRPAPARPAQVPPARPAAVAVAPPEVQQRPPSFDPPPAAPPAQPRRAPTIIGTAPPPAEKPSPPAPVQSPISPTPVAGPPRAALAMTAVLPSSGSTLALAVPVLAFPQRSRRNLAVVAGAATATVVVAMLFLHRPPGERPAPIATSAPATAKPQGGSAPLANLHETSGASLTAAPTVDHASAEVERGASHPAIPKSHAKVRIAHHAAAHQRRYAKDDKHAKHARHERRHAHRTEVASRAAPSPGDDGEARASYQRGNALLFAGDSAGAVAAYQKAVELAPADPIGYRGLGLAHEQQGETAAAIRALRKYLKLAPGAADREIISRRIARLSQAASHP